MNLLLQAADVNSEKFDVFTHETMPRRYHFSNNERISPIYVIPKIGYALTNHKDGDDGMSKGVSVLFARCVHKSDSLRRTTDMTMRIRPCTQCLWRMDPSRLSQKQYISTTPAKYCRAFYHDLIRDGTQHRATLIL